MVRKIGVTAITLYVVYGLFLYFYLYYGADTTIPLQYKGTSVDPTTFLNAEQLTLTEQYSQIRNFLYFLSIPYEWILYFFVMLFGISSLFKKTSEGTMKHRWQQTALYVFLLSFIMYIATYPLDYLRFSLAKSYQISTQSFSSWMRDGVIDFWVNFILMAVIVAVLYWLIRKSKQRWWLYAWLLSIPFTLFLMFFQPVMIDPLYNDFYPLKNKQLEEKILALAGEANIPAEHVYEVNQSEKTNALNAYVTGIGSNARIVLWDTTLNRLDEDEILFIMAHEMAHYVEKHIYIGIAGYLLMMLVGLYLTNQIMQWTIQRFGHVLKISSMKDIRSLPLFLLILSLLLFVSSPVTNFVSRHQEARADTYAIELTENADAAISTFHELTKAGLSQVHPPTLVKIFRYGHPTMFERIRMMEEYKQRQGQL